MKNLNNKAMTLVEVVTAVAVLSIISLVMFNSTMLTLKMYAKGQSIYTKSSQLSNKLELGEATSSSGTVSFTVGGSSVVVSGKYYSQSEIVEDKSISFVEFKPN